MACPNDFFLHLYNSCIHKRPLNLLTIHHRYDSGPHMSRCVEIGGNAIVSYIIYFIYHIYHHNPTCQDA